MVDVAVCTVCGGSGQRLVEREGGRYVSDCVCRVERRATRMLERARIPRRFQDCSFESYETAHSSSNESVEKALLMARRFCDAYPLETQGKGLLFTGSKGLGKTHLAVSILKHLILRGGATGYFWEYKELLEALRDAMFATNSGQGEYQLLKAVTRCDILVLDDLGDVTPSDWARDTTAYILNSRYNENLSTIITTNFVNRDAMMFTGQPIDGFAAKREGTGQIAARETLGDRITDRIWSRLQEMCVIVPMSGEDFRQKVKRASFS